MGKMMFQTPGFSASHQANLAGWRFSELRSGAGSW